MTGKRNSPVGSPSSGNISDSSSKEQDRFLPIANVSRIMKRSLPANAKISKEAKETVQECVSEFISFITGEASDKCQREKRKTINGDDLLWAMTTLGFENYIGPLKGYLNKYRETEGEKTSMARQDDRHDQSDINKVNASLACNSKVDFDNGFYEFGSQISSKNCGEENTRFVSYGETLVPAAGAFNIDLMSKNGDGTGTRAMAPQIHQRVGW
ncbi:hypothetical protein K2173_014717 [Erythroxylum novogranatense]|uniref:Transcription factor CBF/NF-Y/archaeal histone domain-containing protein n=1 Tax=Erythroxylum novogranatense TaxID=1862640 RepID=A0AAV8TFI0_9ROSI|nr:hypothetical protein K2173_014717 [Erythroxylum novogranatense]